MGCYHRAVADLNFMLRRYCTGCLAIMEHALLKIGFQFLVVMKIAQFNRLLSNQ